ncbi:hypothetical protein MMC17_006410 [Xylographa soralifera]|nr:hypothetical protein [Xylographa soralifera]
MRVFAFLSVGFMSFTIFGFAAPLDPRNQFKEDVLKRDAMAMAEAVNLPAGPLKALKRDAMAMAEAMKGPAEPFRAL